MDSGKWMIYGAYGFTGELIVNAALRRNHEPILAGRSEEKLARTAERFKLEKIAFDLQDFDRLNQALEQVELVLNAAGPFVHTALPLVEACLATGTHYLDVAGEVRVFEQIFSKDQHAHERGIAIIPGVGFNVLASDCLASYAADQIESPTELEIATQWTDDGMSPGTTRTMIENFPVGTLARREGRLVRISPRKWRREQRFLDRVYPVVPVSIGDLVTAYETTQIANITTYTTFTEENAQSYSLMEPLLRWLYSYDWMRRSASRRVRDASQHSKDDLTKLSKSQVWVSARDEEGQTSQAWLETVNSYLFTAEASVRSVERLFAQPQVGVLTPALAFGADFVLEIPGTKRADKLKSSMEDK